MLTVGRVDDDLAGIGQGSLCPSVFLLAGVSSNPRSSSSLAVAGPGWTRLEGQTGRAGVLDSSDSFDLSWHPVKYLGILVQYLAICFSRGGVLE